MRTVQIALLAAAAAAAAALPAGYVHTPAGGMRQDCVHEVPSGAEVGEVDGVVLVSMGGVPVQKHAVCQDDAELGPVMAPRPPTPALRARGLQLPADYDGWIEYTAASVSDTYDTFLGYFSVPNVPPSQPDILYLFTGVQNINWIPHVDPLPQQAFDILQPVLQYPADDRSESWSIKSWYVTVQAGAYYSTEIKVAAGDNIFGNMTRLGPQQWLVNSVSTKTGQQTLIKPSHPRLEKQPWAYNTLECYGCQGCNTYPSNPSYFTKLSLTCGGLQCPPTWAANPRMDPIKKCHEGLTIHDSADVTIFFGASQGDDGNTST